MTEPTRRPDGPEFLPPGQPAPTAPSLPQDQTPPTGLVPTAPGPAQLAPAPPERVGRGILFSVLAVVLGAALAGAVYQLGFIASITSWLMAFAAVWLYVKGAGAPPRAGIVPLIIVIVVGVAISLFTMLGVSLYSAIANDYPDAAFGEIMPVVADNLLYGPVRQAFATDALISVAFAALGTFTTLRQLRRNAAADAA